ncbi:MAG TPA: DUF1501 domain-containing protein [Blastocatellia bacterium]|nr:DUF1501 domain-containing protein [Blastocatellia bacterium]
MSITRRQFIKRNAVGMASASLLLPELFLSRAYGQAAPNPDRKILVVIQLDGGNDGLNTVIPYTDSRYYALRPNLSFKESELKDAQGQSTIISDRFGLHPSMGGLKGLYDAGRVAIVLGAGDTMLPSGSHFSSRDVMHTASLDGNTKGEGWLGRYLSQTLAEKTGVRALAIGGGLTKSFDASRAIAAAVPNFEAYNFKTDPLYPGNANNQLNAFRACNGESFAEGSFAGSIARMGVEAAGTASKINSAPSRYRSTVVYPTGSNIADRFKMIAQIILAVEEAELFHIQFGFFDHHGRQIPADRNKLAGDHAVQLKELCDAVKPFYNDMAEHGLADNVTLMTWSEFGRTARENGSLGTDHGSSSVMFVIGNAVRGGLYGQQPSLESADLDAATNPKTHVDFRSVYATILDGWLGVDSVSILGRRFEDVGFFG